MNDLQVVTQQGKCVIDSRQVAEFVDKQHAHLLRDIDGYVEILSQSNFGFTDFFIPSTYIDVQNKPRPCYLITKKGCDMVANKMTGEKGILFTAAYVTKFEQMEQAQKPACVEDLIIMQAQALKDMRETVSRLEDTTQAIKDAIIMQPDNWREDINRMLNKIVRAIGDKGFQELRHGSYELLESRARVNLKQRLYNMRVRMLDQGASKTALERVNKLDVIEADPKLREIYSSIIKEYTIKYVA